MFYGVRANRRQPNVWGGGGGGEGLVRYLYCVKAAILKTKVSLGIVLLGNNALRLLLSHAHAALVCLAFFQVFFRPEACVIKFDALSSPVCTTASKNG